MSTSMDVDDFRKEQGKPPLGKRKRLIEDVPKASITIELPLPHKVLHPNGRTRNYKWRSTVVREYRDLACIVSMPHKPKSPWEKARYRVTFWLARKMDEDNLGAWIKSYLDGLQDAGIVANDSGLTREEIVILSGEKKTGGKTGVRIEIWEV